MRTVGLLIESSRAYGRGLLRGIARFVRLQHNWSVVYHERMLGDAIPSDFARLKCDGVIARIDTKQQRNQLLKLKIPVVDLRGRWDIPQVPRIITDNRAVAELAAKHLIARGSDNFAFCGFAGMDYSQSRRNYFCDAIRAAGFPAPDIYESPAAPGRAAGTIANEFTAAGNDRNMGRWLTHLRLPIGIKACNDVCGRLLLDICHVHGLRVPEQIAVIGVDNDEVLCDLADPLMSSIMLPTERIGYQAAELLSGMMEGTRSAQHEILIPPIEVVSRRSTDAAAEYPHVAAALAFIREKACTGINVEDVLDHLAGKKLTVSRSTLDRQFQETLHFSPKDQIINIRLERVRQLLVDTTDSVDQIARQVGLAGASQLTAWFKYRTGQTPGEFRAHARFAAQIKQR